MADINLNNLDGIPFGDNDGRPANPVVGQPYFNGEASRLELYTLNGWQNITQETPSVVSVTGTLNESSTSTITINGTNFAVGAIASVIGVDGTETAANTTTLVSVVQITAEFPALPPSNAPYDVKILNPSNLFGVLYETLNVDDAPVWTLSSGSLGTYVEQSAMSVTASATDASDPLSSALIYSVSSGSLPAGLSLSSSTGVISGTPANITSGSTTSSFTLNAFDGRNNTPRNYSITITDRGPVWVTTSPLTSFTKSTAYSTTLSATDDDSATMSYSLTSGSFPTGITLNSSTGVLSGTPSSSLNSTFTIRASNPNGTYADRQFTMSNVGPVFSTSSPITILNNLSQSVTIGVSDDSGTTTVSVVGSSLPSGISFNTTTKVLSGTTSVAAGTAGYYLNLSAVDENGNTATRNFEITVAAPFSLSASGGAGNSGSSTSGAGGSGGGSSADSSNNGGARGGYSGSNGQNGARSGAAGQLGVGYGSGTNDYIPTGGSGFTGGTSVAYAGLGPNRAGSGLATFMNQVNTSTRPAGYGRGCGGSESGWSTAGAAGIDGIACWTSTAGGSGTFDNSTTGFAPPANSTYTFFAVGGGGGAGGGYYAPGGSGYYATATVALTTSNRLNITIGTGGSQGARFGNGGTGGTTSITQTA